MAFEASDTVAGSCLSQIVLSGKYEPQCPEQPGESLTHTEEVRLSASSQCHRSKASVMESSGSGVPTDIYSDLRRDLRQKDQSRLLLNP